MGESVDPSSGLELVASQSVGRSIFWFFSELVTRRSVGCGPAFFLVQTKFAMSMRCRVVNCMYPEPCENMKEAEEDQEEDHEEAQEEAVPKQHG